jgi:tRNA/rRNA methyltransferase
MTPRDFGPPTRTPRDHLASLAAAARAAGERIGFLFGPERTRLANEDVYRCDVCLSIPTAPDYGSLNLAQAVLLVGYEWFKPLGGFEVAVPGPPPRADAAAVQALLAHWRDALVAVGFLDPATPKKLIPRLNGIANRLALAPEEVHLLRGIARAMQRSARSTSQRTACRTSRAGDPPR